VATSELGQCVDLEGVGGLEGAIYDPRTYGGRAAYLKTPCMHGKVTIFLSGKLISVGTRSPKEAQRDLDTAVDTLSKAGLAASVEVRARIRNMVAVLDLGGPVSLEELAEKVNCIYEPELFPGLMMKSNMPKATYLIFASGKVVIAGCRNLEELKQAANIAREATRNLGERVSS